MTRSQARQNPDQYTIVPAPIKIIKVLVEELLSASGNARNIDGKAASEMQSSAGMNGRGSANNGVAENDGGSDEDDWEDEDGGVLDLGLGATKQGPLTTTPRVSRFLDADTLTDLMAFAEEGPQRQRDDETQAYLVQFFRSAATKPGFNEVFNALSEDEREKLRSLAQ